MHAQEDALQPYEYYSTVRTHNFGGTAIKAEATIVNVTPRYSRYCGREDVNVSEIIHGGLFLTLLSEINVPSAPIGPIIWLGQCHSPRVQGAAFFRISDFHIDSSSGCLEEIC